jgi:murein L,D-transpeptidase YcbB/YkuD
MTPLEQARRIVDYEARRDAQGHLKVYHLPVGDGGGEREVAGINDRYHPEVLDRIEHLLAEQKYAEAEDAAAEHIRDYTDPVAMLSEVPAVQFALRDMAFNRGPTGAVKILQDALGLPSDGIAGAKTTAALRAAESEPSRLLQELRAARERYERRTRDESSKFWRGLANRWDRQHTDSIEMLG